MLGTIRVYLATLKLSQNPLILIIFSIIVIAVTLQDNDEK